MTEYFDVCIVGSGFGGSVSALRLAEKGLKTVVLERGKYFKGKDFRQTLDIKYLMNLYQIYVGRALVVLATRCVGGGSVIYGGISLRGPTPAFEIKRDGRRMWPAAVSRKMLDPYYEKVEKMLKVNQLPWERIPKKGGVLANWLSREGLTCERAPYAIYNCLECGWCICGCRFGRKQSLILNYLPSAEEKGAVVKAECDAREIYYNESGKRWIVRYVNKYGEESYIESRILLLACGSIETPALLLRSKKNLPSLNWDYVGKNLSLNGDNVFAVVVSENDLKPDTFKGREDGGVISFAYWYEKGFMLEIITAPPSVFPLMSLFYSNSSQPSNWGVNHKRLMETFRERLFFIATVGLTPGDGEVSIDERGEPFVSYEPSEETKKYYTETSRIVQNLAEKNAARVLFAGEGGFGGFFGTLHQLGTCRMGDDDANSVVCGNPEKGKFGEVWGYKNLYIVDGSIFSYSLGVNPALTIAALAELISEGIPA